MFIIQDYSTLWKSKSHDLKSKGAFEQPTWQTRHESQSQHGACQNSEAIVAHSHDGCDEECLVSQFRDNDDWEGCHKGMNKAQVSLIGFIDSHCRAGCVTDGCLLQLDRNYDSDTVTLIQMLQKATHLFKTWSNINIYNNYRYNSAF